MNYSIGEFSKLTNVSEYTLRYYEKEKLILPKRTENGRRCYSENDARWIEFIKRLKDTNMPIKEIQKYAELRAAGDCTMNERMKLLIKHRIELIDQINKANENLKKLDEKITYYENAIEKSTQYLSVKL